MTPPAARVPHRKALLLVLAIELACAFGARWPLTRAPLSTEWDYLLGQAVIASENWHREGAVKRHFIPSRSIDQRLPEWEYRDTYWKDYLSQPPLAFMLHYWASELFRATDPVVVGKVLGQVQLAAGVLVTAMAALEAFGFGAALAGLSFVIWGQPFLAYFVDGYYSTTPAMLCHLALVAWSIALLRRFLDVNGEWTNVVRRGELIAIAALAFLGSFSEWVALFGNATIVLVFAAVGVAFRRTRAVSGPIRVAATVLIASAAAEATTVVLFASKVGFPFYRDAFLSRVDTRTGSGTVVSYTNVLIRQMQTCWPAGLLIALALFVVVVVTYAVVALAADTPSARRRDGLWLLPALAIGFGGGVPYTYRLKNLVEIHWWFAGTWAVGWFTVVCCFAYVLSRMLPRRPYALTCGLLTAGLVAGNLSFARLTPLPAPASREMYRTVGRALPHDGYPMIVADFSDLFDAEYPFATAYLRRPIVRYREPNTTVDPTAPRLVKVGTTEDAMADLIDMYAFGGDLVYVAYDESRRACAFDDLPIGTIAGALPIKVCRSSVRSFVQNIDRVWSTDVSPKSVEVEAGAARFTIAVAAPAGWTWDARGDGAFVAAEATARRVGPGTAVFDVAANSGGARQSSVSVAGQTIRVTQRAAGGYAPCVREIGVQDAWRALGGVRSAEGTVAAPPGCVWAVQSSAPWLTVSNPFGAGDGRFVYTVPQNFAGEPRQAVITAGGKTALVREYACPYTISSLAADVPASGGTVTISVSGDCRWGWRATSESEFVSVPAEAHVGPADVVATVAATTTGPRQARLRIAEYVVTVTQRGS